jgi:hypothetical protein
MSTLLRLASLAVQLWELAKSLGMLQRSDGVVEGPVGLGGAVIGMRTLGDMHPAVLCGELPPLEPRDGGAAGGTGGVRRPEQPQRAAAASSRRRSEQKAASAVAGKTTCTPRPSGGDDGESRVRLLVPEFVGLDGTLSPVLEALAQQLLGAALSESEESPKAALKVLYKVAGAFITETVVPRHGERGQYALSAYGKAASQSAGGEASMGAGGFERVDGLPLTESEKALIEDCATLSGFGKAAGREVQTTAAPSAPGRLDQAT